MSLGFGDLAGEGVELAFQGRVMLPQDVRQRPKRWVVRAAPRRLRELVSEIDPYLVLPPIAHASSPVAVTPFPPRYSTSTNKLSIGIVSAMNFWSTMYWT